MSTPQQIRTWYRVNKRYNPEVIKEVEVVKETPRFLVIRTRHDLHRHRRTAKECSSDIHFDNRADAIRFAWAALESNVDRAVHSVEFAAKQLKDASLKAGAFAKEHETTLQCKPSK